MKKTKSTATAPTVAPQTNTAVDAPIDWSSYLDTSGFEQVSQDDLGIPFLTIVQSKSPEVDKTHKDYATKRIEGCELGDIINTVTREIVAKCDKGYVTVIPCFYEKTYNEWKPNRGGLVKVHRNPGILEEVTGRTEKGEGILRNSNLLMETATFYVLVRNAEGKYTKAVINMISTQLKNARLWLNMALGIKVGPQRVNPPFFSHHYILTTSIERKDNNAWYGWKIQLGDMINSRELVETAKGIGSAVRRLTAPQRQVQLPAGTHEEADEVPM